MQIKSIYYHQYHKFIILLTLFLAAAITTGPVYGFGLFLEPDKKNTGPAILSSALIKDIPEKQPLIFLSADHLIKNVGRFNKEIKKNKKYLTDKNIFIFGIKPNYPSDQFGYFITKKYKKNLNKVTKFIEKPKKS